ncbi:hypothetical protein MMC06_003904 [Schaereria dolodes]|nr:hypothetical protein [Schaereria dolodes]
MLSGNDIRVQSLLISFYDPVSAATDSKRRTLSSILAWDDSKLECCHDYIQILFPLPERSPFNITAPIIDQETFDTFRSRPELRGRMKTSFARMLSFYGFEMEDGDEGMNIFPAPHFLEASKNWVTRFDHNHLRITRIIRSLRVLGLENEAEAFFAVLKRVYNAQRGRINQRSFMFWTRAAQRPLYLTPDDEEDEGDGQDFLYEYEKMRTRETAELHKERGSDTSSSRVDSPSDQEIRNSRVN